MPTVITATHRLAQNVASLFARPDSSSERISQIIWGSSLELLDVEEEFTKVIGEDLYVGWVYSAFLHPIANHLETATTTVATLFAEVYVSPNPAAQLHTRLTVGAKVLLSNRPASGHFVPIELSRTATGYMRDENLSLTYGPQTAETFDLSSLNPNLDQNVVSQMLDRVGQSSVLFIGVPYLWGGTTPFGIDCSGFTQLLYKINGVQLLRDAVQQWSDRRFSPVMSENGLASPNFQQSDLLFFSSELPFQTRITHVGLSLGDGRFIHAAGKERGVIVTLCSDPEFAQTFVGGRRLTSSFGLSIDDA